MLTKFNILGYDLAPSSHKSSDEYQSMKSTIEVLSDPELIEQIKVSRDDYNSGKFKKPRDIMK